MEQKAGSKITAEGINGVMAQLERNFHFIINYIS